MYFADHYYIRYKVLPPFLKDNTEEAVDLIVTIPCMDDDFIFHTLESLESTDPVCSKIEVIVHVNSGEQSPTEVIEKNRKIFQTLKQKAETGFYTHIKLLPIGTEGTIRKKAGVGFARRVAMDEAVRRFASIQKPDGLIIALDADTLVEKNYFQEIAQVMNKTTAQCFTFQFQHHYDSAIYPPEVINACKMYEIYLRYYRLALKTFQSPFAIHTIGSCFAIRAYAYTQLGGMPPRQGGEDFYFLQKAAKMNPVCEVRRPIVFPSPRISNRVPFGTGPSVRNIIEKGKYTVYNFELFRLLKVFYDLFPACRQEDMTSHIPPEILNYIGLHPFKQTVEDCRRYSATSNAFVKRMLDHFDAFFIVKFLNTFNQSDIYPPIDVFEAGKIILNHYGITEINDLYNQITCLDRSL